MCTGSLSFNVLGQLRNGALKVDVLLFGGVKTCRLSHRFGMQRFWFAFLLFFASARLRAWVLDYVWCINFLLLHSLCFVRRGEGRASCCLRRTKERRRLFQFIQNSRGIKL